MTWRVDRQFEQPEFYASKALAMAREKFLKLKGANVVAWEMADESNPVQPVDLSAALEGTTLEESA